MATLRELKGRIGSVASSEKITGAMKMISSAKMHKAESALKQLRPFRSQIEAVISNLLQSDASFTSPLMSCRPVHKVALVVWGSDDGLCGAYNVNIFKFVVAHIADLRSKYGEEIAVTLIPVGSKMTKALSKYASASQLSVSVPEGIDSKSSQTLVRDFAWKLRDAFVGAEYDRIECLYMNFMSVSRQSATAQQLLPVSMDAFDRGRSSSHALEASTPYIYEPSVQEIFSTVLPMYLLAVMQDIFTENRASEQAARVMAMQSANDNAKKLHDQLQLEFNKLRQQAITTELLDILGGQVK